jgi:hypothetical protein
MWLSLRMWILAGCLSASVLSPSAIAADSAATPISRRESQIVNRVLTHWRDRQEKIRTFRLVFESKRHSPISYAMDERGCYRLDVSAGPHEAGYFRAFNGTSTRVYFRNSLEGQVLLGDSGTLLDIKPVPVVYFARPSTLTMLAGKWRVIAENAIVGNTHCVKLQMPAIARKFQDAVWVDPKRDDIIIAREQARFGVPNQFIEISYCRDKDLGWVPSQWIDMDDQEQGNRSTEERIASFSINPKLPKDTFTPAFPPFAMVVDRMALERYTILGDGSKKTLEKWDSLDALKTNLALEQLVDFTIEPEPLKDALGFIALRYDINFAFDAEGIRKGLIDPSVQVTTTRSGMRLEKLLSQLLKQSKRPLAYEVRKGIPTIVAAPRPK